jgi:cyanophycinase
MRSLQLLWSGIVPIILSIAASSAFAQTIASHYVRVGNFANADATPQAGFALMGGGEDLDDAFRWLCERAAGGDLLVLRATGDNEYSPYINKLCKLNSVATLVIPNRSAATEDSTAKKISRASAVFIAGGDQANYINFWRGTPVQAALNAAIRRGVPIGGTSAGLAVLGEFAYSAQGDKADAPNLDGKKAMADPFSPRVTLVQGFLDIPVLTGIVFDTHFAKRDRMGRLLVFLARMQQRYRENPEGQKLRCIGIEERAAVLLESDGQARVVGKGPAYFIDTARTHGHLVSGTPVTYGPYDVFRVSPGHSFNVKTWHGDAVAYTLSVEAGTIHSTQPGGGVY